MKKADELQLSHFDNVIEQAEEIKKLRDQKFFQIFISALHTVRREALERILTGTKTETREELIGYAKLANYVANFFDKLSAEGAEAVERKQQLLEQINLDETNEQFEQSQVRYRGHGAL